MTCPNCDTELTDTTENTIIDGQEAKMRGARLPQRLFPQRHTRPVANNHPDEDAQVAGKVLRYQEEGQLT